MERARRRARAPAAGGRGAPRRRACAELARDGAGWRVVTAGGAPIDADAVVARRAGARRRRGCCAPLDAALAHDARRIEYASSAIVTLAYRRRDVAARPRRLRLRRAARASGRPLIACTFSSRKYPGRAPDGHALLRAFVGGALRPHGARPGDDAELAAARAELRRAARRARRAACSTRVARHPRAMPQYDGRAPRRAWRRSSGGRRRAPGLALAGAAYRGVGIPDCVRSGEAAAETLIGRG